MKDIADRRYTWKVIAKKYAFLAEKVLRSSSKSALVPKATQKIPKRKLLQQELGHLQNPSLFFEKDNTPKPNIKNTIMNTEQLFAYLLPTVVTIIIVMLLLPLLIKLSPALKLVDIPNERKVHKTPIPAIGGMVIVVSVIITYFIVPSLHTLLTNSMAFAICLVLLMITGVVDDRLNISAALRFLIQIGCAVFVAANGIRLTSLHGILGLYEIPVAVQYMLTVTVITGVTNAFNLIDGIDGLAGSFSVINLTVLSIIAVLTGQEQWLALFLPLVAALLVFLKYNWRPLRYSWVTAARFFFGFFTVTSGIMLIEKSFATNNSFSTTFMLVISAACIIPVVDTVRVFYQRMQKADHLSRLIRTIYIIGSLNITWCILRLPGSSCVCKSCSLFYLSALHFYEYNSGNCITGVIRFTLH